MAEQQGMNWLLERDAQGIAWLGLDKSDSAANVLSTAVLAELAERISELERETPRGLVIHSRKSSGFIAGADVSEFDSTDERSELIDRVQAAHDLFARIEALACPSVAMIDGFCLGGGLELALSCTARVASDAPSTRLGLPEVRLGIHPGFGGTWRMLRLVGPIPAMDLMLSGRTVTASAAKRMGLVDAVAPPRQLRKAAMALLTSGPKKRTLPWLQRLLGFRPVVPLVRRVLEKRVRKLARPEHYPAPFKLLDLWQAHAGNWPAMARAEVASVVDLSLGRTSRNLIRLFKLQDQLKASAKRSESGIAHVHVIGAGVMGGDIAVWCALRGLNVTLQDTQLEAIGRTFKRARKLFQRKLKQPRERTAAWDRLQPDPEGRGLERADLVIEAIIEDLNAKSALLQALEPRLKPDALLATNTSSIPLESLAASLQQPQRLVGLHFFNPVAKMPLVEVIFTADTGSGVRDRALALVRQIDRLPLTVKSSPAFLVNRVLTPYLLEAVALADEGVPLVAIDRAAREFGMPMGPVELADRVGLDVCLSVARHLAPVLGVDVPTQLEARVAEGKLGVKTGEGFYVYRKGKPVRDKKSGSDRVSTDVIDRMVLRLANEAVACLREGVVDSADQIDAGMVFGTGFAPFRGGPLQYVGESGVALQLERLTQLEKLYGERFKPDAGWKELN